MGESPTGGGFGVPDDAEVGEGLKLRHQLVVFVTPVPLTENLVQNGK